NDAKDRNTPSASPGATSRRQDDPAVFITLSGIESIGYVLGETRLEVTAGGEELILSSYPHCGRAVRGCRGLNADIVRPGREARVRWQRPRPIPTGARNLYLTRTLAPVSDPQH